MAHPQLAATRLFMVPFALLESAQAVSPSLLFVAFSVCLAWAYAALRVAAFLKVRKGAATGYSRKTFHILVFSTAAGLHVAWGLPAVCVFGAATSVVIGYALLRGAGHPLYVAAVRSVEGSLGVGVVSGFAVALGIALIPGLRPSIKPLTAIPALAVACAIVEAVSPHGWDNATMQIVPPLLIRFLM